MRRMSRIFFLDDTEIRRDRFAQANQGCVIVFAESAQEAIDILSKDLDFDQIYLDHDLGNRIFIDSNDENSGYQVAKFLCNKDIRGEIIVHSWNRAGAQNMIGLLPQAKYQPFNF